LLDILKKSEHTDEDKTFLLSLVPGFKKLYDDKEVLGEDGNAGNYESKNYGVSATVCTVFYCNDMIIISNTKTYQVSNIPNKEL